jgi:hypothetical protein
LWSAGDITVEELAVNKGKMSVKTVNPLTGRESSKAVAFGDTNWGPATRKYMVSLNEFRPETVDKIFQKAEKYMKVNSYNSVSKNMLDDDEDVEDKRACIPDLSDDEEDDCKISKFLLKCDY